MSCSTAKCIAKKEALRIFNLYGEHCPDKSKLAEFKTVCEELIAKKEDKRIEEEKKAQIEIDRRKPNWERDLEIVNFSWSNEDFGIAKWLVTVKNNSSIITYKDVAFKAFYCGKSGTVIDSTIFEKTIYEFIGPNETKKYSFSEFAHSQSDKAGVVISNAMVADK